MKASERYHNSERTFRYHCNNCLQCIHFDGSTRSHGYLCLKGIEFFDAMMRAKMAVERMEKRKK